MLRIHILKIKYCFLDSLVKGFKKCEIRINDRDYQTGELLEFREENIIDLPYDRNSDKPRIWRFKITHVTNLKDLGMDTDYVALSVKQEG